MIRAVATDVDGTITDSNSIMSLAAVDAIRDLESRGIMVMLCSGNALCVLKALARYIGCTGPAIAENGAVIEYRGKLKIIGERGLAQRAVCCLKDEFGESIKETWSNKYRYVDAAIMRTIDLKDVEEAASRIQGVKVIDSGFAYHIIDRNVDKGKGLQCAAKWAGIDPKEIAGVGDSTTDCELLRTAAYRYAVANAAPELKEVAEMVADKQYGDGFAEIARAIIAKSGARK